jgi:hypothetical protein
VQPLYFFSKKHALKTANFLLKPKPSTRSDSSQKEFREERNRFLDNKVIPVIQKSFPNLPIPNINRKSLLINPPNAYFYHTLSARKKLEKLNPIAKSTSVKLKSKLYTPAEHIEEKLAIEKENQKATSISIAQKKDWVKRFFHWLGYK